MLICAIITALAEYWRSTGAVLRQFTIQRVMIVGITRAARRALAALPDRNESRLLRLKPTTNCVNKRPTPTIEKMASCKTCVYDRGPGTIGNESK